MCANPQSNWLNTIAVRASYILPILKRFPRWKPGKTKGLVYLPPEKTKIETYLSFFDFWGRSFKLAKFHWNRWDGMLGALMDTLLNMFRSCYVKHNLKYFVAIYREIHINCWEWEIVAWEKEITMRDYRLVFLSRWATASQRSVFLSKWRNNWVQKTLQSLFIL